MSASEGRENAMMTKPMPLHIWDSFLSFNKSNPQKKSYKENSTVKYVTKSAKLSIASSESSKTKLMQSLH